MQFNIQIRHKKPAIRSLSYALAQMGALKAAIPALERYIKRQLVVSHQFASVFRQSFSSTT
jgi:hypothetical protein